MIASLPASAACGGMESPEPGHGPLAVTVADANRSVSLSLGQKLDVELPSQGGTGYGWQLDPKSTRTLRLDRSLTKQAATIPGGGEVQRLTFTAVAMGAGELQLDYAIHNRSLTSDGERGEV